jgi:hypothetical protein
MCYPKKEEEALARIVCRMAQTGEGTDACINHGCLPLPVNFYSPVPDINDLKQRKIWDRVSKLEGIDFRPDMQEEFLLTLGKKFGSECAWPPDPTDDPYDFYTENMSFSYGCAAGLHGILRHFTPHRIIEVGSGNSSLVISSALKLNKAEGNKAEYTIIDPYPRDIIKQGLPGLNKLIDERVELTDVEFFDQLKENDVLFIDSGHTVRTGSDVNYLFLDILPRLAPGVIVHIHDIGLPYEYPETYATNPAFRMFWTESYLLQAFLAFNNEFEILLAMSYLLTEKKQAFCTAFPLYNPDVHKAVSGSFWIRRKSDSGGT